MTGDNGDEESSKAGSRGTLSLSEDIDAVKKRVEKYTQRRALATESDSAVEESRKAVIQCYKKNPERPLECWKEVENFRKQVAGLENVRSHRSEAGGMADTGLEIRRLTQVMPIFIDMIYRAVDVVSLQRKYSK